jgi:hypothetical protein
MKNEGVIEKCLVEGSVFDLGVQAANVGFIVGENAGTITGCLVRGSSITNGSSSVGGVAGLNSTMIQNSGVIESTIAGNANSIGGIVGTNSGTVQDVFFLSTVTPKEIADGTKAPPVSNNGGGIVGENVAYVKRAMYLAVAPKSTTHIYPIMRVGSATDSGPDASFYLYGGKYRVMPGANGATVDWVSGSYNLEPIGGGGKKLDTEGLDLANLEQSDPRIPMQPYGWASTASGEIRYPYPVFDAANPPASWPETEGVGRPKQAVGDWQDAWVQPMKKMNFLNGEFDRPYVSGKPNNAGLPTSGTVGQVNGVWHGNDVNVYMTHVEGWSARPTNPADYKPDNAQYLIELANPRNDFMPRDYKGNPQKGDLTKAPSESTYAELNAAKVGTLYQVADTEPGQEFYYSFHHASRLWPMDATSTTDTMNFYLSPTGSRIDPVYNNIADEDKLQLIRPVASPHESSLPEMEIDFYPYANNGGPTGMIQSVDRDGDRRTAEELSDDLPNTSWKAFSMNTPLSFFRMGGHHFKVVRYEMTRQKSDAPMLGDPNEWELQGTTDGVNWTTVDRRGVGSNDYTVTLTSETTTFIVQNPGMYWEYRFVFKNAYYLEQTTMTGMPQYPAFSELKVYMPDARALEAFGRVITFPQDALGGTPHTQNPGGYNYGAWQTVKYGPDKTAGMKTYWKAYFPNFPDSDVYLYDVWIGDLDSDKGGYGLTFWSKQNFDVVKNEARGSIWWYGYNTIDQFEERLGSSDVVNNVIGYWDVDNGWKQYYGRYIVPPGQTQTEFAYQATTKTPGIGNFLDAAMFKPAAVLSVSEVMYKPGDTTKTPVTLADPGDHLTLEMTITANGDQDVLEARNVTLTNEFGDFSQYFKYDGEVRINDVPPSAMAYRHTIDSKGNSVFTANNLTVPPGQSVVVSFEIEILKNIYGNAADYSTLFYFIQNQAKVEYTSFKVDEQLGRTMTTYSPVNQTVNISQIPMNKTITEVDAAGNVLAAAGKNPVGKTDSIFQVELTLNGRIPVTGLVSDTLPKGFALVEDSITKLDGTPLEEGDAEDYILYGEGTDYPRLVFLNVDFVNGVDKQHGFCYQMTYVGDQFGVTNAGVEAYYRFRYESTGANGVVNADIISLPFTEPKLGIRATAPNEHFIVPDEGGIIPNLVEHSNINRADLPYVGVSFLPEIVFYEADGTTLLPVTESEGHPVISTADYTAKLMNDNSLNFAPASGSTSGATIPAGDYILYYKIAADDTANSGFDLSSESVGTITITVDATATAVSSVQAAQPAPPAPAPDAPNPAPPAVLPPVAAATLGLLSAALGGEAGASVSGKNGVSAAVATMLGALSLLLVLTGLVLLPEKKRRPKR